ncbi:MAG: beta-aspartyl-peptidase [Gammaproteobacteria bacterium]|nr:beta-aspartyl-peptidase [Gammaproteobacteria bacterium]MBU2280672.1 beta-aspartyl-peptidase [Gammaproteobacteria bacterium]MBU2428204.1 beta-aspartyl-peptidase [Gammaproteobacteria bacterium]
MTAIKLFKNAHVLAPEDLGVLDVLVAANKIVAIGKDLNPGDGNLPIEMIDANGFYLTPGFVDSLVHFIGGGGEGGFATRTPEMQLTDATLGGVTTAIGVLGTDATTRTLTNLLAKAHALEIEGISTYCHTGSYQVPCRTIMGSVTDDLILIDKFIGVGEIAISDHRSSQPSLTELRKVAAEARVGGMLAGKGGIVSVHVGAGASLLDPLHRAIAGTELQLSQFYPTHINRNQAIFAAGLRFAQAGGVIDFTTSTTAYDLKHGEVAAAQALALALTQGIPVSQLTLSSDGNASLPIFSSSGQLLGLEVGKVSSLYASARSAVMDYQVTLSNAIAAITSSPADVLGLHHKGRIAVDKDADIVLIDKKTLHIDSVFAKGKTMVKAAKAVVVGTFETKLN